MLLRQFVPYQGTVHCTEQGRVRVQGTEVPHIYMGHKSHIHIASRWSLTRLSSHPGKSDKTGLAGKTYRSGCAKTAPSPTNENLIYHHLERRLPLPCVCLSSSCLVALLVVAVTRMSKEVFFGIWKSSMTSTLFFASPVLDFVLHFAVLSRRRTGSCRLSTPALRVLVSAAAPLANAAISAAQAFNWTISLVARGALTLPDRDWGPVGFPRSLPEVGVLVGTPASSAVQVGAPLSLHHHLLDCGLDLVFRGALMGAPTFSRMQVRAFHAA